MKIFRNEIGDHLGDIWIFVSAGLKLSERLGEPVGLSRIYPSRQEALSPRMIEEVAALMDSTGTVVACEELGNESFGNLWRGGIIGDGMQLCPTKRRWDSAGIDGKAGKPHTTFSYQFDGRVAPQKNPPAAEIPRLLEAAQKRTNLTPVALGMPLTIAESLEILIASAFLVGCCSGMATMAMSTGIPVYLLEYNMTVDQWLIGQRYVKCARLHGFTEALRSWPEYPTGNGAGFTLRPATGIELQGQLAFHQPGWNQNAIVIPCPHGASHLVAMTVRSIRAVGQYLGALIIVAEDLDDTLESLQRVAMILVRPLGDAPILAATSAIDPSLYRTILVLEAGVLCMKALGVLLQASDVITYWNDPQRKVRDCPPQGDIAGYFDEAARRRHAAYPAILAAVWCVNGRHLANTLAVWTREHDRLPHAGWPRGASCQAAMNSMIRKTQVRSKPFQPMDCLRTDQVPEERWMEATLLLMPAPQRGPDDRLQRLRALVERLEAQGPNGTPDRVVQAAMAAAKSAARAAAPVTPVAPVPAPTPPVLSAEPVQKRGNLIYLTARGDEFKEMAVHCIRSLRSPAAGAWTGDIRIICNGTEPHLSAIADIATLQVVPLTNHIRDDRLHAMAHIDVRPYEQILNLDCDILAFQPIGPLFHASDELLVMEERWQTYASYPDRMYISYMTDEERRCYRNYHPINVGHWVVAASLWGKLQTAWFATQTRMKTPQGPNDHGSDQSAFNALCRRQMIPVRPFQPWDVGNATKTAEADWPRFRIIHYAGYQQRLPVMRRYAAALPPALVTT